MQVLNTGTVYRIYDESMRAFTQLPPGVYKIAFNPMAGYSLIKSDPIEINEKIYGNHLKKVEKVYNSFKVFPRNLGVILSGDKGIGKSLFAKLLSVKAIENGYPVIMCDTPYPGIADFLGSIQQEIVVLFDEFDKTFAQLEGQGDPQAEMLTLFDGLYMGKKLFIITCNELRKLNDFLVNRPGRFHYHFRFAYPNDAEVTEYLQDNIAEEFWGEIPAVAEFAKKVDLNYDCLRAIAFELNMGSTFADAAADLNIINIERNYYNLTLYFKDGTSFKCDNIALDVFGGHGETNQCWLYNKKDPSVHITFDPSDNTYDYNKGGMIINGSDVELDYFDEDNYDWSEEKTKQMKARIEKLEKIGIDFLLLKRNFKDTNIHYLI